MNHREDRCLSFGGLALDRAMEWEILKVVQPAAVEAAVRAGQAIQSSYDERIEALELALRQARYEAERARRQYDAVEPENRLVVAELERRWNQALTHERDLELEVQQARHHVSPVTPDAQEEFLALAEELPWVWNHPQTDMRLKKRIVRTLVEEIIVDRAEDEGLIEMVIHWTGGRHSLLQVKRNRIGYHRHCTDRQVVDLVQELSKVAPDEEMARILNRLGYKTGKGHSWTQGRVRSMRRSHGIAGYSRERQEQEGWLNMAQAARELGISPMSVCRLLQQRILEGHQVVPYAPWLIQRQALLEETVQAAARNIQAGRKRPLPGNPGQGRLDFRYML